MPFDGLNWEFTLEAAISHAKEYIQDNPFVHATMDFETRSACELVGPSGAGAWVYSEHPTTEAMCLAYMLPWQHEPSLWHMDHEGWAACDLPLDLFAWIIAGGLVEAHNAFFERCIWENVCVARMGWPEIDPEQWRCSASRASVCALPRDLDGAVRAVGLPIEKDMVGNRLMKRMSKPRKPTKHELTDLRQRGIDPNDVLLWVEDDICLQKLHDYC